MPSKRKTKPIRIPLKHAIIDSSASVCVITKDPQREYKDLFEEKGIKADKVVGISKLRSKFKPFEAKRQLCASFDLFIADDRVLPLLPSILGKTFFDKKRLPVPINLKKVKQLKEQYEEIMHSTFFNFTNGCCSAVKIGLSCQTSQQVVENIMESINLIVDKIPGKWDNIQSIHLKTADSTALPLYNSIPQAE